MANCNLLQLIFLTVPEVPYFTFTWGWIPVCTVHTVCLCTYARVYSVFDCLCTYARVYSVFVYICTCVQCVCVHMHSRSVCLCTYARVYGVFVYICTVCLCTYARCLRAVAARPSGSVKFGSSQRELWCSKAMGDFRRFFSDNLAFLIR